MSEATHTPAPWTKDYESDTEYSVNADAGRYWKHIATVKANKLGSEGVSAEEAEENARLIAAAPDLLESLSELVDSPNAKQNAMWDRAREAIRKARGV